MHEIRWAALPHCPDNQLVRNKDSDAGFDIRIADDTLVTPYTEMKYKWEYVCPVESTTIDTRILGECARESVTFISCKDWATLDQKLGEDGIHIVTEEVPGGRILVECTREGDPESLSTIVSYSPLVELENKEMIIRKKYEFPLVSTGILLEPVNISWHGIYIRSGMIKYGVSLANSVGVVDWSYRRELMLTLISHTNQFFSRGERLAQLIPHYQFSDIKLTQVEVDEIGLGLSGDLLSREGFGSSGTK